MSLKLGDAWRLSWASITGHKARSLLMVLTITILFGAVLGVSCVLQGLENTVVAASVIPTEGEVYALTRYGSKDESMLESEDKLVLSPASLDERYVVPRLEKYHGGQIGTLWTLQVGGTLEAVSKAVVEKYITVDLAKVPEDRIPVILPRKDMDYREYGGLQEEIDTRYYVVGALPEIGKMAFGNSAGQETTGFNLWDYVIGNGSGRVWLPWLVDDGSGKVERYFQEKAEERWQEYRRMYEQSVLKDPESTEEDRQWMYEQMMNTAVSSSKVPVVRFANPADAAAYTLKIGKDASEFGNYDDTHYWSYGLFSDTLAVVQRFALWKKMLIVLELVLLVVAVVIATLTFGHMIDQDAATIALYRAMGATKLEIMLVYLCYLIELCVIALGVCLVMALGMAGVTALMGARELGQKLQEFYHLAEVPKVGFVGLNWVTWTVVGAIFAIAPVTLVLADRHFSPRNIARKLKED